MIPTFINVHKCIQVCCTQYNITTYIHITHIYRISRKPLIVQPSADEDITLACVYLHNFLRRNSAAKQLHSPPGTLDFKNTDDGTVLEKCYEYYIEMHVLFIDFKQAFDSVDVQKIIQILQELIPNKLVRLIKVTIQNTEASVKIKNLNHS
jgi:hypothetical protein